MNQPNDPDVTGSINAGNNTVRTDTAPGVTPPLPVLVGRNARAGSVSRRERMQGDFSLVSALVGALFYAGVLGVMALNVTGHMDLGSRFALIVGRLALVGIALNLIAILLGVLERRTGTGKAGLLLAAVLSTPFFGLILIGALQSP